MKKITRKQAVSNLQCLFDDFFKTYFRAPKEAIDETLDNARFYEQKEKLKKAVYSAEYSSILGQLDSESFRKYYEKVGEFAKAYKIDMRLFTEETPALIEDITDVLKESPNIAEKLDLINGFTDEELRTERISFGTKTTLIESILDCWFVGDDKEQGINRMLMSLTAEDRQTFVRRIGTDRKFLNRLFQCVNGGEKDEMLAILGEIFISTGFTDGKDSISLNNDGNDRVTGSFEREKIIINITKVQAYGMRARATNRKIEASPLDIITMNYDGMIIRVPAFLLLNSWSNTFATQEGIFFNYKYEDIDWNSLDERQKDEYFSEFVRHYMGEALFSELVGNPLGLIVTTIVGILLLWVASIPAAFMAVVGAGIAGTNVYAGAKLLTTALEKKKNATSMHEFKKAAKLFAESIAKIGVNVLMLIVSLVQTGKAVYKGKTISITPKKNTFKYKHNPSDNPKVLQDAIVDENAVYGYSPNPKPNSRISEFSNGDLFDWSNPDKVKVYRERRIQYHIENDNIDRLIIEMKKNNKSIEEIARSANAKRNQNRLDDYIKRNDFEGLERIKKSNLRTYGNELGITAEDALKKYGSWEKVIEKTKSANPGMDACCGLYDEYFDLYNDN